jgi:hypothetical protein
MMTAIEQQLTPPKASAGYFTIATIVAEIIKPAVDEDTAEGMPTPRPRASPI